MDKETELKLDIEIKKTVQAISVTAEDGIQSFEKLKKAIIEINEPRVKLDLPPERLKEIQKQMIAASQAGVRVRNESERFLNKPGRNYERNFRKVKGS